MAQSGDVLEQLLKDNLIMSYEEYAVLTLALYEFTITLDQEVTIVWNKRLSATSLLLLVMRWIMVLDPIVQAIPARPTWCRSQYAFNIAVLLATTGVIALFSALRVYALWQASQYRYILSGAVFLFGAVPIGTNIYASLHIGDISYDPLFAACDVRFGIPSNLNRDLLFLTRSSAIFADVLVLVLTWIKSFAQFREMRRLKLGNSMTAILLRDGTVYFIALLGINIFQLLTFFSSFAQGAYAADFLQSMPPLLVQRFLLNLRRLDRRTGNVESYAQNLSRFSVSFRVPSELLGNIGEPLEHGPHHQMVEDVGLHEDNQFCHDLACQPGIADDLAEVKLAPPSPSTGREGGLDCAADGLSEPLC